MANPAFKVKEEKIAENHSEFAIEPLEPGYGHTLGNALRRTLLTSIPGAAVTSIKITGVRHRFSTIPGVKENVVDFLLNMKGLNFRLLDESSKGKASLSVKGSKKITGADFDLPENVEIVNKDHYVASINDKKAKLEMELTIEQGLGYSSAEERRSTTLGLIPTDAVFTPVKRVSYEVSATRVGRQTDLDKLVLSVWTNGIVSPKDALVEASKILTAYFLQVYEPKSVISSESISAKPSIADNISKLTIDELDLPTRIYNSLRNGGIETLGQLLATTKKDLISMRNMGNKSIMVVEEKLKEKGVALTQ
ncbi:MAG: DNA-directed RNA polymerase subunit alpha [Candidatus Levybacteria bacterium RIFCSPLOWO2_01_FULL_39_24]|nr:MAG: DNA-directed RNA polymerase subunit alpha [Candidatus Levybacteria bacterium RIFCSPHIGHO2_01_FULL_40_16]OGH28570.1 MAG: DNA-directed RNA polymerase subunit alpha [Candidatus Levybacteria bacterium RIFCSPHIGHO2_12_FULL_39_9]OGH45959.1 MAG: DNA-directed RNA polymerase subunit alpha [Candidatus Levybacteria bacterium RIFCSPLOWO2_01_FULL_39_24]